MALGRFVRWRLIVVVTPLLTFVLIIMSSLPDWTSALSLTLGPNRALESSIFSGFSSAMQAVWFSTIAGALLIAAGARRRWLALPPAVLAVVLTVQISAILYEQHVVLDPVAVQPLCTTSGPKVCVPHYQEPALAELAAMTQPMLRKLDGIPGAPTELRTGSGSPEDEGLNVYRHATTLTGQLAAPEGERELMASYLAVPHHACPGQHFHEGYQITQSWLADDRADGAPGREWITSYYAANRNCDAETMRELVTGTR